MKEETKEFLSSLSGFLKIRDTLDEVALTMLPEGLANQYENMTAVEGPLVQKIIKKNDSTSPTTIKEIFDQLYAVAEEAKLALDRFGRDLVMSTSNDDPDQKKCWEYFTEDNKQLSLEYYPYSAAPLKGRARAEEKAKNEYDGSGERLLDLVRASFIVDSEEKLNDIFQHLFEAHKSSNTGVEILRFKNRYHYPTFSGYRDALFNLKIITESGNEMIVELQIHLVQIMAHKMESHKYYEFFREFFAGNMDVVDNRMKILSSLGKRSNVLSNTDDDEFKMEMNIIIQKLADSGEISDLDSLENLMSGNMLADYDLAIICAKAKINALEKNQGGQDNRHRVLEAKFFLGQHIFYQSVLQRTSFKKAKKVFALVRDGFEELYGTSKCQGGLKAAMFHAFDYKSDPTGILLDQIDLLGEKHPDSIECKYICGMYHRGKENWKKGGEGERLLTESYRDGCEVLGTCDVKTLEFGYELARLLLYSGGDSRIQETFKLIHDVYKGGLSYSGRTVYTVWAESTYIKSLKKLIEFKTKVEEGGIEELQQELKTVKLINSNAGGGQIVYNGMWYYGIKWQNLPENIQAAGHTLGWNIKIWNKWDGSFRGRNWDELTETERQAAKEFGYRGSSWNRDCGRK